jgi:putative peptidoglycan lipid II flippase
MGMLNAQDRYGPPALAPATFNVITIAVGVALYLSGVDERWVVIGWAAGTVLGGLGQLGIQLPPLWRLGYRPKPKPDLALRDPGVRRVGRLMLPAIGGLAAMQVNIFVNTMFATSEAGAVSWLNYAFRFLQLPIGVFGVAIATVTTTRFADAAADSRRDHMGEQLVESLRLVAFLTVPATVGLLVLGEPIIRLIFERGAFDAYDTWATAQALYYYSIGLVAYAAVKVLAPAFYAIDRARFPMIASITAVAGNLAINIALHPHYGYRVLAFGTAVAALLNFAMLYVMFDRRVQRVPHLHLLGYLVRVGLAAAVMGAAAWGAYRGLAEVLGTGSLIARLIGALGPVILGALVYGLVCRLLQIAELGQMTRRLRRN